MENNQKGWTDLWTLEWAIGRNKWGYGKGNAEVYIELFVIKRINDMHCQGQYERQSHTDRATRKLTITETTIMSHNIKYNDRY